VFYDKLIPENIKYDRIRVESSDNGLSQTIIFEKLTKEEDITNKVRIQFIDSKHSDGYYIALMYKPPLQVEEECVAVIGATGILPRKGYDARKAPGASISFQIFKIL
jgi:hypothetical protein